MEDQTPMVAESILARRKKSLKALEVILANEEDDEEIEDEALV